MPHQVLSLLEQQENRWLIAGRIGRYQEVLLDNLNVSLKTVSTLNPAPPLPEPDSTPLFHDCIEITDEVYSSGSDLQDDPLDGANWT